MGFIEGGQGAVEGSALGGLEGAPLGLTLLVALPAVEHQAEHFAAVFDLLVELLRGRQRPDPAH